MRVSWDEYFMQIAEIVKTRSTCLRRQVGAVIVRENRIITTGYNGAPSGLRHCTEIIQAAKIGVSTEGCTIYITLQPCVICAKMLVNAGIVRIVHKGEYPDELSRSILEEAGIEIVVMD